MAEKNSKRYARSLLLAASATPDWRFSSSRSQAISLAAQAVCAAVDLANDRFEIGLLDREIGHDMMIDDCARQRGDWDAVRVEADYNPALVAGCHLDSVSQRRQLCFQP